MSAPPKLGDDLTAFIEGAVPSVWALETLLLLKRNAGESWTLDRLATELRANTTLVGDCVRGLERVGLASHEAEAYRYSPASPALSDLCDQLEASYRERPVAVVNTIARRRVDPLKGFAESFRLGGWK